MPFSPEETKIEIRKLESEFSSLETIPQDPEEPNVYHARIFLEKPVEILMLKEMLIPYSFFPMMANPSNSRDSSDTYISKIGYTDFSKYTESGFVYVILNGYQYNFILKNRLFKGIKILQDIDYESLALSDFHLGMNDQELNDYIKYLYDELQEAKDRDPDSVAILNRFHSISPPEDFAIFGLLNAAVTRIFSHVWNLVRINTIRVTGIKLSVKLSFDPRRLQPPKWVRDRLKINVPKFVRNALTPPKWIRDRMKVPRELQNLFVKKQNLWGRIAITDPFGNPLKFKKRSRDLHLEGGNLRLSALPTAPQLFPDTNIPLPIPTGNPTANHAQVSLIPGGNYQTNIWQNGFFHKKVMSHIRLGNIPLTYQTCIELDSREYFITSNGYFPVNICVGSLEPRDLPHIILIRDNGYANSAAAIQWARKEVFDKLAILTKKTKVIQGGLSLGQHKLPGEADPFVFAPCGLLPALGTDFLNMILGQGNPVLTTLTRPILDGDIYIGAYNSYNVGVHTVIHEYMHVAHCSQVGQEKYLKQIERECWTACGGTIAMPICDDFCSDEIEESERWSVVKHPLHLFDRFEVDYELRKGRLTCDIYQHQESQTLEYDRRYIDYTRPARYKDEKWIHEYDEKIGTIRFQHGATDLGSLPFNTINTVLQAKDEEKGYFEYYVEK
ncbi:MAG: hypothetical protein KDK54_21085 [Leptospiraceae bacterium]|nr:hypothetical protein [Leptospiraceae bacterium]